VGRAPCQRVVGLPCDLPALDLAFGDDYAASVQADKAEWEAYREGQAYWVRGTNLLVMTHRPWSTLEPGHSHGFHGSASAGAVSLACPGCYVLVVQDSRSLDGEPLRLLAESYPWVDLVTSTNWPDGGVGNYAAALAGSAYSEASRALHDSGRLFFGAAGNTYATGATPVPYPDIMLPPWVVLIGGAHSECGAQEMNSGHPMEVAGNFTQRLPAPMDPSALWWTSGTSFATPAVAGAFGQALLDVRQALGSGPHDGVLWRGEAPGAAGPLADGDLTQEELRAAVAAHARWFAPAEYAPASPMCLTAAQVGAVPAPVGPAPWMDLGWGYAGPAEARAAAAWLLGTGAEPDAKPAAAVAWMAALQQARGAVKG
jgi:hypothetical protein